MAAGQPEHIIHVNAAPIAFLLLKCRQPPIYHNFERRAHTKERPAPCNLHAKWLICPLRSKRKLNGISDLVWKCFSKWKNSPSMYWVLTDTLVFFLRYLSLLIFGPYSHRISCALSYHHLPHSFTKIHTQNRNNKFRLECKYVCGSRSTANGCAINDSS